MSKREQDPFKDAIEPSQLLLEYKPESEKPAATTSNYVEEANTPTTSKRGQARCGGK